MFTTLAVLSAMSLTPAQAGGIALANPRITYGELGPNRPDTKLLPGDIFFFAFDIDGLRVADTGRVRYSMAMEVIDSAGKSIFKQNPAEQDGLLPLGGTRLPARAYVSVALDQAPGMYTCKVTVTDLAPKERTPKSIEHKFEVLPKGFGMVAVYTSADLEGKIPTPMVGIPGQMIWIHCVVVGFGRDGTKKQPDLSIETTIYDKDRKTTLEKPMVKPIPDTGDDPIAENMPGIPLRIPLPLNRDGGYYVEIKAVDKITKKETKIYLPLRVAASN